MPMLWYYRAGEKTIGPLSSGELKHRIDAGDIDPSTPVRCGPKGPWMRARKAMEAIRSMRSTSPSSSVPAHEGSPSPNARRVADDSPESLPQASGSPPEGARRIRRLLLASLASLVFHLGLILALGVYVLSACMGGGAEYTGLFATVPADLRETIEEERVPAVTSTPEVAYDANVRASGDQLSKPADPTVRLPEAAMGSAVAPVSIAPLDFDGASLLQELSGESDVRSGGQGSEKGLSTDQLSEAGSAEEAVGGIMDEIERQMSQGDLMVVWMFDASVSLENDRQRIATQLQEFFGRHQQAQSDPSLKFMNAAVAFGQQTVELVKPTRFHAPIVAAIREVPYDASGVENICAAISWAVAKYPKHWDGAVKIVVWTDESGDDMEPLEKVISRCRERKVTVSIVGPSAILSRRMGVHPWIHQPTGQVFHLPVCRGPDVAIPERLYLPYWHEPIALPETSLAGVNSGVDQGIIAGLPGWYGGPQLEMLGSGAGPYALTRMALATGGSYTILDRGVDRSPFRLATMRPYLPDYRDHKAILEDLKLHPLRQAIVAAATMTIQQTDLRTPQMMLPGLEPVYMPPARFQNDLRRSLQEQQLIIARLMQVTTKSLAFFGSDRMKRAYEKESSPRWRAWYELTMGRLLAVQCRCMEYARACELLPNLLGPDSNYVVFQPASELRCAPVTTALAAEAATLLERCVQSHPDTPWMYLAQRELQYPVGIAVHPVAIPAPSPKTPQIALPSGGYPMAVPHAPAAAPAGRAAPIIPPGL